MTEPTLWSAYSRIHHRQTNQKGGNDVLQVIEKPALLPSSKLIDFLLQPPTTHLLAHNEESPTNQRSPKIDNKNCQSDANLTSGTALSTGFQIERELKVKIVVVGGAGVGKSALIRSFRNMPFVSTIPPTIGVDIVSVLYSRTDNDRQIRAELWDVSHREIDCDQVMWKRILSFAAGVIVVCDISNHMSFFDVDLWRNRVATTCALSSIKMLLLVNKTDLNTAKNFSLSTQVLQQYTKVSGFAAFALASAKAAAGVHTSFETLIREILLSVMSVPTYHNAIQSEEVPYLYANCVLPLEENEDHHSNQYGVDQSKNDGNNNFSSSPSGTSSRPVSIEHSNTINVVERICRVVENVVDLALPTEAFASQKTAVVLTTRRPDHCAQQITDVLVTGNENVGISKLGSLDMLDAKEREFRSTLSTQVVIMRATLHRSIMDIYDILERTLKDRRNQAEQRKDSTQQRMIEELQVQRAHELNELCEKFNHLPLPSSDVFVYRAPEALGDLQTLRRLFLRKLASWQYAFQSLFIPQQLVKIGF